MRTELLSVIIPYSGKGRYAEVLLRRTLLSLVGGFFSPLELVLVTQQDLCKFVADIADSFVWQRHGQPRIVPVSAPDLERRVGIGLNQAVTESSGRYLAVLKPGVLPYEHAYTVMAELLSRCDAGVTVGAYHTGEYGDDLNKMYSRQLHLVPETIDSLRSFPLHVCLLDRTRIDLPAFDESSPAPQETFLADVMRRTSIRSTGESPLFLQVGPLQPGHKVE